MDSVTEGVSVDTVRKNEMLIAALAETWDGSEQHAIALSAVIRGLGVLHGKGFGQQSRRSI